MWSHKKSRILGTLSRHYSSRVAPSKRLLLSNDIRRSFLDYFVKQNGHEFVKSSPVVPFGDPTVPFVNAGMTQFKNIFLNKTVPRWKRVANSQKCIRVNDLAVVGTDSYHHTFFEMLGNWSFGDYGKEEACRMAWNLLIGPYGIHPSRLYVTYFAGDLKAKLRPDLECLDIWRRLGLPNDRILPFGMKDNFWMMGNIGPSGPCTEIHVDHLPKSNPNERARFVNAGLPDLTELWNIVFMEYNRNEDGSLTELPQKHIDTGMGFERLVAILQEQSCNYNTDLFTPIFDNIARVAKSPEYKGIYNPNDNNYELDVAYRVLADHARMASICIADEMYPNFQHRLRRVVRKSIDISENIFKSPQLLQTTIIPTIVEILGPTYDELEKNYEKLIQIISYENDVYKDLIKSTKKKFTKTKFNKLTVEDVIDYPNCMPAFDYLEKTITIEQKTLPADVCIELWRSFGLDEEIILKIAKSNNLLADIEGFNELVENDKVIQKNALALHAKTSYYPNFEKLPSTQNHFKYNYEYNETNGLYDIPNINATILAIEKNSSNDKQYHIVTDRSNFYFLAGGQECDSGTIVSKHSNFQVNNVTTTGNDVVIHTGEFLNGTFVPGDEVVLNIDGEKRTKCTQHHTAAHLLQSARKHVFKHITYQTSCNVSSQRIKMDFGVIGPKPTDSCIADLEKCMRNIIASSKPVETLCLTSQELYSNDNIAFMPGSVYPDENISVLKVKTDEILSMEPCCGTHVRNTKELHDFHIINFKSGRHRGLYRLEAVSGLTAMNVSRSEKHLQNEVQKMQNEWADPNWNSTHEQCLALSKKVVTLRLKTEENIVDTVPHLTRIYAMTTLRALQKEIGLKIRWNWSQH